MAVRALLTIWVAAAELSSPGTQALVRTAQDALGPTVEVRLEGVAGGASRPGPATPSSGVVELAWDPVQPGAAHLRCYVPAGKRWIDRSVTFGEEDPPAERGRTLGFLVASIYVDEQQKERSRQPVPPPRSVPSPARPVGHAGAAAAVVAVGPGDATGFGARLVVDYDFIRTLRVGIVGEGRLGTLPAAQATTRVLALGGQLTFEAWRPEPHSWLGPALGVYAMEIRVIHLSPDDPSTDSQAHWLPAFQPVLSAGWGIGLSSAVFAEGGVEVRLGRTTIVVEDEPRAEIGLVTPTVRLGLRTDF